MAYSHSTLKMAKQKIKFIVNDNSVELYTESHRRLLDILHEDLNLTSVKEGCGKSHLKTNF